MATSTVNNLKLGAFVISGLLVLIVLLYMVGKQTNLFSANFQLRTHFRDIKSLQSGNNVLFAGKQIGTVKDVYILNDTTIEVIFYIENEYEQFLRTTSLASIGTDGLVGNRVLNITPGDTRGEPVKENDILPARAAPDTDEMMSTLYNTNNNIAFITAELRETVTRINDSKELWALLADSLIAQEIHASLGNIRRATAEAAVMVDDLHQIVEDVQSGKGSVGSLLTDTTFVTNLNNAVAKFEAVGNEATLLVNEIDKTVLDIQQKLESGKGPVNALLQDTTMTERINNSLINIEQSTEAFNENMEALKHNFLFRGYFKKLEREQRKEEKKKN